MPTQVFQRITLQAVRRKLSVVSMQQLSPRMLRICFESEELSDFSSPSADDHLKIFLPATATAGATSRHFTPRLWNPESKTLALDFALHLRGPAVDWARAAKPGDTLEIAGPRSSTVVPTDFDWYLLIGDATGLPSIARRIEELPNTMPTIVFALVEDLAERRYLDGLESERTHWLRTTGSSDADAAMLLEGLKQIALPRGHGFIWIAAETSVARAAFCYARDVISHPKEWIKAAGYWSANRADGGERIA